MAIIRGLPSRYLALLTLIARLVKGGLGSRMVSGFMLVAMLTVVSKAVSFVKDASVASRFGTGDALDAFMLSFGVLSFAAALVGGGLPEAFLPVYAELRHRRSVRRAQRLGVQSCVAHAVSLLVLAVLFYFFAEDLVRWTTRGFSEEKQLLAARLMRRLIPFMVCFGMSYQLSAWLRSDKAFTVATSAPMLVPLTILGMLLYHGKATTVETLVIGTEAGAILHLTVMVGALACRLPGDLRFWWCCLRLWEPGVRRVVKHTLHFLFAGGIFSSAVVVDQMMAAWLAPGSVVVLGYTEKVCGIILAVTAAPACDVLFPYFADKVAHKNWIGVRHQLFTSAAAILSVALPAALMLCWLAPWVIHVLFERGSFTAADTTRVAEVLRFAALQIPFYILGSLASRVIVAMQATHFIIVLSTLGLVGNAALNYVLMQRMGAAGIALATVLVQMTSAGLGCLYVLRQIKARLADTA